MPFIRYISEAQKSPSIRIAVSRNQGRNWQEKDLSPGQSFAIPHDATNLQISNVPYDPNRDYEVRGGRVVQK